MYWTWDLNKNEANRQKHGIDFEVSQLVFSDPLAITTEDSWPYEQRWKTIGAIKRTVVIVIDTWPNPNPDPGREAGRIISARKATRRERAAYEEG